MARREADAIPLSRFGALVAQLESIVASAHQQPPDAILCFDLISELVAAIEDESKESIQQWQRKCEDTLYSLLILGVRCPVRRLASLAMVRIIAKGDGISIYSRVSSLQGWLADGKRSEALSCAGVAHCLGELYRLFGRRITSGLTETANIAAKLMKFYEDFVRKDALKMLENALEGCGGSGPSAAYSETYRIIMRVGVSDKSFIVRFAAARCLKTFASIGGPGLGIAEFESSILYCLKALDDPVSSVRDAFAEALGGLLALAMNPEAQVKQQGTKPPGPVRKLEDGLQKHFILPFVRASGVHAKDLRIGITLSWVFFLQVLHHKHHMPDSELQTFALPAMDMLKGNDFVDPHALACVLYILRVGIADQLTESSQRSFMVFLGRKLESADCSPSMRVAALRILSYHLTNLGDVPVEFKDILDYTVVAALSDSSLHVRIEAALTLRALAKVDPICVGGLISYGVTTLHALREGGSLEKGTNLNLELNSLHGQAALLAALVSISPKLLLGYPARLSQSVFEVSKKMLTAFSRNPIAATVEKEAGWLLLASLIANMPKEELEDQVFDVLLLWASPFAGNPESYFRQTQDLAAELPVLSAAIEALTAFIRSFVFPTVTANGVLLQPVLAYLSGALFYISYFSSKQLPNMKSALALFTIRTLMAYQSIPNPMAYENDHKQIIEICTSPFSDPSGYDESSSLRTLLDKKDASLGPWIPGSDWYEDELRAFDGGKDGLLPCVWDDDDCIFPQKLALRLIPKTVPKDLTAEKEMNRKINKFKESAWKCIYYLSGELLSLSVTYNEPWFRSTRYFWVGPGDQVWPDQKIKLKLKAVYMHAAGFYTYSIFALIFWETRRSDFGVSMSHHVATVVLIVLSYIFRFARVGSVVLAIHDASDVFLEIGKMSKYSGCEWLANASFLLFVASWVLLRLTYYPFWILRSTSYEVLLNLDKEKHKFEGPIYYYVFNTLLFSLLVLHIYWWVLIYRMLVKQIQDRGHVGDDVRSDSEGEEEHED